MKHAALLLVLLLAACNTIEGAGEDLGKAGGAISDTARSVGNKL